MCLYTFDRPSRCHRRCLATSILALFRDDEGTGFEIIRSKTFKRRYPLGCLGWGVAAASGCCPSTTEADSELAADG